MEILLGLAISTGLVLGWLGGSRIVCTFLTLPVLIAAVFFINGDGRSPGFGILFLISAVATIWAPYVIRMRLV